MPGYVVKYNAVAAAESVQQQGQIYRGESLAKDNGEPRRVFVFLSGQ